MRTGRNNRHRLQPLESASTALALQASLLLRAATPELDNLNYPDSYRIELIERP
jgi:hypothetical protein